MINQKHGNGIHQNKANVQMKRYLIFFLCFILSCATFRLTHTEYFPPSPQRLEQTLNKYHKKGNDFAVLIGGRSEIRHKNNISIAYQTLLSRGYRPQNIFILDSDGGNPPQFPITDTTTKQTIGKLFWWMSKNINTSNTLLIYMTGHGIKRKFNTSVFTLNTIEDLRKFEFIQILREIHPKYGIVITDFCYWGVIKDESLKNWVFMSVTDDDHTSYGTVFSRKFWRYQLKNKSASIIESFVFAGNNDPGVKKGANRPDIYSINPELLDIKIYSIDNFIDIMEML